MDDFSFLEGMQLSLLSIPQEPPQKIGPSKVYALPLGVAAERSVHHFLDYFLFLLSWSHTSLPERQGAVLEFTICDGVLSKKNKIFLGGDVFFPGKNEK